jgi:signal transduction histidine kinase
VSDADLRCFRELHAVLERVRPELDAAIEAAAIEIPTFARLIQSMDASTREAQAAASQVVERAALCDGDWPPYAEHLRTLGTAYAHMGIEFEDWHALLRPYREVIEAEVRPATTEAARAVITGMHLFLDKTMAVLADAYIGTKEQLVLRAEAQLSLYAQMFRESPLGKLIYEWTPPRDLSSFRLLAANPSAAALTGPGVVDRLDEPLDAKAMPTEFPERLARALQEGQPQQWTARRMRHGEEVIFECRSFAMGADAVGVLIENVTERLRTQEALARYTLELERSNRELDDFAYVASHDLKAPLRDIDSLATWINEDATEHLPDGSKRHLSTIRDRIARMEQLLEDLLQYSRAGRRFHEPEAFDLRTVVANVLMVAAPPSGFEVVVTGESVALNAPRVPLELVLRNLVANAVKHHHLSQGRIEIALAPGDEQVEIAIRDDGPGIPAEFHGRVFRMFQTLRPRDEVEGSGIGLAIVKKVVEAHGGAVTLESAPGKGSTFRFTWPREWKRS